jgi:hypothetical protein
VEFICPVCTAQRLPTARARAVARVAAASEQQHVNSKAKREACAHAQSHTISALRKG